LSACDPNAVSRSPRHTQLRGTDPGLDFSDDSLRAALKLLRARLHKAFDSLFEQMGCIPDATGNTPDWPLSVGDLTPEVGDLRSSFAQDDEAAMTRLACWVGRARGRL